MPVQCQATWSYPILSPNMPADTQNAKLESGTFCWCLPDWLNTWMLQPFQGFHCCYSSFPRLRVDHITSERAFSVTSGLATCQMPNSNPRRMDI